MWLPGSELELDGLTNLCYTSSSLSQSRTLVHTTWERERAAAAEAFRLWSIYRPRVALPVPRLKEIALRNLLVLSSSIVSTEHLFSDLDGTP